MAIVLKGDFIGFSFNGYRSEDLGIVRVSDGSRYNEDLLPTSQDKTVQVPGGDGFYYFGSDYTQKQISVSIAFDSLNERDFHKLQQVFGTKELGKLIFDEKPYKYYMVKSGKPQLKYICFGKEGDRIYKGEGTLNFTAYYPYAKSAFKFLNKDMKGEYVLKGECPNINEWAEASGMKEQNILDKVSENKDSIRVYNAGDLDADFILKFNGALGDLIVELMPATQETNAIKRLSFKNFEIDTTKDSGFQINTKTNLIEGFDKDGTLTGNLYNKYISEGDFFKIPADKKDYVIKVTNGVLEGIDYDYIYY